MTRSQPPSKSSQHHPLAQNSISILYALVSALFHLRNLILAQVGGGIPEHAAWVAGSGIFHGALVFNHKEEGTPIVNGDAYFLRKNTNV